MGLSTEDIWRIIMRGGVVRASELLARGATRRQPSRLAASPPLERPARGHYRTRRTDRREEVADVIRIHPRCVIGLLSAAWLHGWRRRAPDCVWALVPRRSRRPATRSVHYIYWSPRRLAGPEPRVIHRSIAGANVPVTAPRQTAWDLVRFRHHVGEDIVTATLRSALGTNPSNLVELWEIARDPRRRTAAARFIRGAIGMSYFGVGG